MVTLWPWAAALVVLGALGALVLAWRRPRGLPDDVRWVARTHELEQVPAIRAALRRARVLRVAAAAGVVVATVSAAALVARPAEIEIQNPRDESRDIVLCLDVSGSMTAYDAEIVRTFERLVDGFTGERIALSLFDSTSRTVFPLTDDYAVVSDELAWARTGFSYDPKDLDVDDEASWEALDAFLDVIAGTQGVPNQASLIGDGLASCALLFDEEETERSRSIVLATDNYVNGEPIYTLPEAVQVATGREVAVYALYPGGKEELETAEYAELEQALADATRSHGFGGLWPASDPRAVDAIIRDVTAQQRAALEGSTTTVVVDKPGAWPFVLVAAFVLVLAVRWRTRS